MLTMSQLPGFITLHKILVYVPVNLWVIFVVIVINEWHRLINNQKNVYNTCLFYLDLDKCGYGIQLH